MASEFASLSIVLFSDGLPEGLQNTLGYRLKI